MELLNLQFAILLIKVSACAIPGVVGLAFLFRNEEGKRAWRDTVCRTLFGFANAMPYKKFAQFLLISGLLLVSMSVLATWFLLLSDFFKG